MAVMARHMDIPCNIASEKIALFKQTFNAPKGQRGADKALARARKFMTLPTFTIAESIKGKRS